ncbi:uncharacterized protein LOC135462037 [Liolophura sinensis]|uniref:uncharacterized protein LOC135462037 n=1 Tax=Liolophura sinensis TaxID=3198878 RepID=UPI00315869AB
MAKVSTICSIVLLTHYMGFTKALDKLNILVPYDAAWSETWLEATLDTYRDAGTDTPLEYSTMWINQTNVFMLALQHFSLDGNWTAILDLTSDCYLWEEPGSSTPLYIALAFCSTDIPSISPSTLHFLQAAIDILQSQKINLDHLALILDDNQGDRSITLGYHAWTAKPKC